MTNYKIKEDRKEASEIFTTVKKTLKFEETYHENYKNLNEYFTIVNKETKTKEEAEKEKRDKFNSKITLIAATITILTFISVLADIFNLFDRFFK